MEDISLFDYATILVIIILPPIICYILAKKRGASGWLALVGIYFSFLGVLLVILILNEKEEKIKRFKMLHAPKWKRSISGAYGVCFFIILIFDAIHITYYWTTFSNGSTVKTVKKTEILKNHGKIVYVEREKFQKTQILKSFTLYGAPGIIILGILLKIFFKVPIFIETTGKS